MQLERLLGCPSEHLEFHTWYLRQKGWIERLENGQLSITADGVDRVIERNALSVSQDRLLNANNQTNADHFGTDEAHAKSNGAGSDNGQLGTTDSSRPPMLPAAWYSSNTFSIRYFSWPFTNRRSSLTSSRAAGLLNQPAARFFRIISHPVASIFAGTPCPDIL